MKEKRMFITKQNKSNVKSYILGQFFLVRCHLTSLTKIIFKHVCIKTIFEWTKTVFNMNQDNFLSDMCVYKNTFHIKLKGTFCLCPMWNT